MYGYPIYKYSGAQSIKNQLCVSHLKWATYATPAIEPAETEKFTPLLKKNACDAGSQS